LCGLLANQRNFSMLETMMITIRHALLEDAQTLAHHRSQMFIDMRVWTHEQLLPAEDSFQIWLHTHIPNGRFVGWCACEDNAIVASVGLLISDDFPPLPSSMNGMRGRVVNMYCQPSHRRRGIARSLMTALIDYCRTHNIMLLSLSASGEGQTLYESLGFKPPHYPELFLTLE
jgi:GNAT superfamily N-acetyltransferase